MTKKTIGVIGLGSIGMRHARNLLSMGHNVIGYDPVVNPDFEHQWPIISLAGVVDGVVIASPTPMHAMALQVAIKDRVHVLVEKPIADKVGNVPLWLTTAYGNRTEVMVGTNLRFHSCVKKAKEWLDEGLIGKPLWANFTCAQYNDKPAYLRDGVLLNWGAHEVDLALYLLGPASVEAAKINADDTVAAMALEHVGGVMTTINLDYITKPQRRYFTIQGGSGCIHADLEERAINLAGIPAERHQFTDSFDQNYIEEMRAFINLIDGKEVSHAATGYDGLACLELLLEAKRLANAA